MKITPIGKGVLIKSFPIEEERPSGLILPEHLAKKPSEGIVFAVGKDVKEVKVGDRVLHSRYAFSEIEDDEGIEYIIIQEKEILTKIIVEK